jgi:hypothetical protein
MGSWRPTPLSLSLTLSFVPQIQKLLLEADNKLILGTLDNIGYACTMRGEYEKALPVSFTGCLEHQTKQVQKTHLICRHVLFKFLGICRALSASTGILWGTGATELVNVRSETYFYQSHVTKMGISVSQP